MPRRDHSLPALLSSKCLRAAAAEGTSDGSPFLMMDYYNRTRGCLIPEKGVSGAVRPYSASIRHQHWTGSNHCRYPLLLGDH
ncbi:hypothetical protein COCON_G00211940 [Conger conger]|uniref:Uncharacterized protein n=1 Tax=Conger conger TaxID=82655 RepID=A0A9Q1D1E4_CONCO|nr:hypothetical protein COCON_G00211940 [Conger conger]